MYGFKFIGGKARSPVYLGRKATHVTRLGQKSVHHRRRRGPAF